MSNFPVNRTLSLPEPRHSYVELCQRLELYLDNTASPTWAGTAAYLGIPRSFLDVYASGQVSSPDAQAIAERLQLHRTHIEAYLEGVLTREKGSPAGAQFALKAQMGWEDKVQIELSAKPQLSVVVSGELGRFLARADIEDAELVDDTDPVDDDDKHFGF